MADDLLSVEEVCRRLGVGKSWLYEHLKAHPHYRLAGRRRIFTADDFRALIASLPKGGSPCPSNSSAAAPSGTSRA